MVGITKVGNQMSSQQKTNCCFNKQLGYYSCVAILPMLIQQPMCY